MTATGAEGCERQLPDLPLDVACLVLHQLSVRDRVRCIAVCKSWQRLLSFPAVWSRLDVSSGGLSAAALQRLCERATPELIELVAPHDFPPLLAGHVAASNPSLRALFVALPEPSEEEEEAPPAWRAAHLPPLRCVPRAAAPLSLRVTADDCFADALALYAADAARVNQLWVERSQLTPVHCGLLVDAVLCSGGRQRLSELRVRYNSLGAGGCAHLARLLGSSALLRLHASWNDVGDGGCAHLGAVLRDRCCSLAVLELCNCMIGPQGARALAAALPSCRVRRLNLSHNRILSEGARALARALERGTAVRELDISFCDIAAQGVASLTPAALRGLTALRLAFNGVCAAGARGLAASLARNASIELLDVGYNGMGDEGLRCLCVALRQHAALRSLRVPVTSIGPEGARRLGGLLRHCPRLRLLDASGNALGRAGGLAVAAGLAEGGGRLQTLRLRATCADDSVGHALAAALRAPGGARLRRLELDANQVGDDGARALAAAAARHASLALLSLRDCFLGAAEGSADLAAAVEARLGALCVNGLP